jgi:hypothetical protein
MRCVAAMGAVSKVLALECEWSNLSLFMKCSDDTKPNGQILNGFRK